MNKLLLSTSAVVILLAPTHVLLANPLSGDDDRGFFKSWSDMVNQSKEEQPHWITPLVTVTPRLEQEFRYDQSWQAGLDSASVTNYGGAKGLELIPTENTELIVGVPAYQTKETKKGSSSGWGDETFTVKYRALSANEEQGNFIVTGFMGVSVPNGDTRFSSNHTIYTPTLAVGKGWGTRDSGMDVQSTFGVSIPDGDRNVVGMPMVWNTAFQAHLGQKLWPEVELNYTHWKDGPNDGKTQVAITTGVIVGRIPLSSALNLIIGAGYQQPVSSFRTYEHTWISTARMAF